MATRAVRRLRSTLPPGSGNPECPAEMVPLQTIDRVELSTRASQSLSAQPRPFLRWAGSKRALLRPIVDVLPAHYRVYWEPFLGAGSLYFALKPGRAVLGDSCRELIDTYAAVRDSVDEIIGHLNPLKPDKNLYYHIRSHRSTDPVRRAAEFLYLNKTCWNGLYRVNSRGDFNVPYGRPKTDFLMDNANLRACSTQLQGCHVSLQYSDFEVTLRGVGPGDLVFLDPPYVTRHNNNGFVDYNETLFSWADQVRLARIARALVIRGAHIIVSNADHKEIRDLYEGFRFLAFSRYSTLAGDCEKRGPVQEGIFFSEGRRTMTLIDDQCLLHTTDRTRSVES